MLEKLEQELTKNGIKLNSKTKYAIVFTCDDTDFEAWQVDDIFKLRRISDDKNLATIDSNASFESLQNEVKLHLLASKITSPELLKALGIPDKQDCLVVNLGFYAGKRITSEAVKQYADLLAKESEHFGLKFGYYLHRNDDAVATYVEAPSGKRYIIFDTKDADYLNDKSLHQIIFRMFKRNRKSLYEMYSEADFDKVNEKLSHFVADYPEAKLFSKHFR